VRPLCILTALLAPNYRLYLSADHALITKAAGKIVAHVHDTTRSKSAYSGIVACPVDGARNWAQEKDGCARFT
jgi:hypothetical protein